MVPKFRAWDKENDRMIYPSTEGVCFELDDDGINILDISGGYPEDHVVPFLDSVLMQSTGLKDKNGVDIFEGDVGWDAHFEEYGEVVFENGSFRYEFGNISEDLFEVTDDIEIVGNIYENPELLEQADES